MNNFLAIDIETTGLNEGVCQILEIGMVLGDYTATPVADLPYKRWRFAYHVVVGEPFALRMNAQLISDMIDRPVMVDGMDTNYIEPDQWALQAVSWLKSLNCYEKLALAGKNVSTFDIRFLQRMKHWQELRYHHRLLDPGMLWKRRGEVLAPDTKECIRRSGLPWDSGKLHSAIWDCRLVVELLRTGEERLV